MLYNNFDYSTKYTKQIGIKENNPIYLEDKSVYIRRKVQYFLLSKNVQEEVNSLKSTMRRNFDMYTYSIPRNLKTRERMT